MGIESLQRNNKYISLVKKSIRELKFMIMKVKINKEADIIIASSVGYTKDINLYQGTKASEDALWR